MKNTLTFVLTAAICAFGTGSAFSQERKIVSSPAQCSIELNGDSILHGFNKDGYGQRHDVTPAEWLVGRGYPVNEAYAINGQSTYQLTPKFMQRTQSSISSHIVVLQTGINDYRKEYQTGLFPVPTVEGVKRDYRAMVDRVRARNAVPVIAGITNVKYPEILNWWTQDQYNTVVAIQKAVREVATEKNVHYASFDLNYMHYTNPIQDPVHPDQASSNGLAENLRYVAAYICGLPF